MKKQQGFTLIELLIVVAIIGVLSAIAIPTYKNYIVKSDIASGVATARGLLTNTDLYIQENSVFPTSFTAVGGATDMSSLGALSFIDTSGANGTIKFLFNSKSAVDGSDAQFVRSASGWKCTFTPKSGLTIDPAALPKGCGEPTP
ncbi:prepilin-type N-terminal cleavage/methylation domain-containing protein [Photobacterium sp. GB-210]|uniref:pilin n=1 Tax=Photobacterium sp. GB-210 TaxID=2022104 RepID=UPI000D17DFEF|nr:pilin [Photobacterium sp. GB-210]PSV39079.1 prepilin-type cleavage/methylation domain-containing protein [Photobacterium sp. GB-210]